MLSFAQRCVTVLLTERCLRPRDPAEVAAGRRDQQDALLVGLNRLVRDACLWGNWVILSLYNSYLTI